MLVAGTDVTPGSRWTWARDTVVEIDIRRLRVLSGAGQGTRVPDQTTFHRTGHPKTPAGVPPPGGSGAWRVLRAGERPGRGRMFSAHPCASGEKWFS